MIQCYNYNEGRFTSTIDDLQDKLQNLQKQIIRIKTQDDRNFNYKISDNIRKEIENFEVENGFEAEFQAFRSINIGGMQVISNRINTSYLIKIWSTANIETSVLIVVNDFPSLCDVINDDLKFLINSEIAENISNIELTVD